MRLEEMRERNVPENYVSIKLCILKVAKELVSIAHTMHTEGAY